MRVYLPSTLHALAEVLRVGEIASPVTAFAVTPAVREWYASGSLEELEYAAMTAAARASLRMIAADPSVPRQRVVLAAEIPGQAAACGSRQDRAAVLVKTAIPLAQVLSAHVDGAAAALEVEAAVAALPAADAGDEDARFTVDSAEGNELLLYAASELSQLIH